MFGWMVVTFPAINKYISLIEREYIIHNIHNIKEEGYLRVNFMAYDLFCVSDPLYFDRGYGSDREREKKFQYIFLNFFL